MKLPIQLIASVALAVTGAVISAYNAGQLSVRKDCDDRYRAYMHADKMVLLFHERGLDDYYHTNFAIFRPSGRMYSGSSESGLTIVGGAALSLFGIALALDTLRVRNTKATTPP